MKEFIESNYIIIILIIAICYLCYNYYYKNQEQFSSSSDKTITLYYADWCPVCAQFMPIWNEFKNKSPINTKEKDCTQNNSCPNIPGFPTVILSSGNKTLEYNGDRTVDDLIKFCSSRV